MVKQEMEWKICSNMHFFGLLAKVKDGKIKDVVIKKVPNHSPDSFIVFLKLPKVQLRLALSCIYSQISLFAFNTSCPKASCKF